MSYILSFPLPAHIRKNDVSERIRKLTTDARSLRYSSEKNIISIRSSDFNLVVEAKTELETPVVESCINKVGDKYVGKYPIHPDILLGKLIPRTIGRGGCFIVDIQNKIGKGLHIHVGDKKDNIYTITGSSASHVENAYELLQKNEYSVLYETAKSSASSSHDAKREASRRNAQIHSQVYEVLREPKSRNAANVVKRFPINGDIATFNLFSPLIGLRGQNLEKMTSKFQSKSFISVIRDAMEYSIGSGSDDEVEEIYAMLQTHEDCVIAEYHENKRRIQQKKQRGVIEREVVESDSDTDESVEEKPRPSVPRRVREPSEGHRSWADMLSDDEDDEDIDILDKLPSIRRN